MKYSFKFAFLIIISSLLNSVLRRNVSLSLIVIGRSKLGLLFRMFSKFNQIRFGSFLYIIFTMANQQSTYILLIFLINYELLFFQNVFVIIQKKEAIIVSRYVCNNYISISQMFTVQVPIKCQYVMLRKVIVLTTNINNYLLKTQYYIKEQMGPCIDSSKHN